jgi:hypothetical protein
VEVRDGRMTVSGPDGAPERPEDAMVFRRVDAP